MASDLVTPSVEQRCIIEFAMRLKIKSTESLCKLNAHNVEADFSRPNVYDSYNKFSEGRRLVSNLPHAHVQATAVRYVSDHKAQHVSVSAEHHLRF
jgi:hypothetical protein